MMNFKKPANAAILLAVCLLLLVTCLSACSGTKPKYELAEQTEYVRPETRELITDPELAARLTGKSGQVYFPDFTADTLQSPVALVLYDASEKEYSFGVTDLFETTKDLSEANSVVLLEVGWSSENISTVRQLAPRANCMIVSPDGTARAKACTLELPEEARYGDVTYSPHYTADLDNKLFRLLSETIQIGPTSPNTFVDVITALGTLDHKAEIQLLKTACQAYDYPEAENLASHPELVDWTLPLLLYSRLSFSYLQNPDPARYSTPDKLFAEINRYASVNETLEAWGRFCSGETTRLIGLLEYVGGNSAGTYYYQNSSSNVVVYAPIYRVTVVDVNAGRAVGWYSNRSVKLEDEEIFSSKVKEANGYHYYDFYSPEREFLEAVVQTDYLTVKTKAYAEPLS